MLSMGLHHLCKHTLLIASLTSILFLGTKSYTEYSTQPTQLNLAIINSYSGAIQLHSGNAIIISGGQLWVNQKNITLDIAATTGSRFETVGDLVYGTGDGGTGAYTISREVITTDGDELKRIQMLFWRNSEPYSSNIIELNLDTTPPTIPQINSPTDNTILTGIIDFMRTGSQDFGVGISKYYLHLSLDPGFLGETIVETTDPYLDISSADLPQGTLFWYVEARDLLGNTSKTVPHFFHNTINSTIRIGYSGGGGGARYSVGPTKDTATATGKTTTSNTVNTTGIVSSGQIYTPQTPDKTETNTIDTTNPTPSPTDLKQILLSNYYRNSKQYPKKIPVVLPGQNPQDIVHQNAGQTPNSDIYKNSITKYYYHKNPLGYLLNYISSILTLFYITSTTMIAYIRHHKKSLKIFDK